MAGVLLTCLSLVIVAVASMLGAFFLHRKGSKAWKKFAVFAIVCLSIASVLLVFFIVSFV